MSRQEELRWAFKLNGTDKLDHGYSMIYDKVPSFISSVLEIGIGGGHSIRSWTHVFPNADIWGIDINGTKVDHPRVTNISCDVKNFVIPRDAPEKFDLIVDDASHLHDEISITFRLLHKRCQYLYVIEDVDFDSILPIMTTIRECSHSYVASVIQTGITGGDRAIVVSFDKVIQW